MTQLVKEYEPDDTMAEMEMEKALSKLTLGKKNNPNDLLETGFHPVWYDTVFYGTVVKIIF
jgi:hypothetical protein